MCSCLATFKINESVSRISLFRSTEAVAFYSTNTASRWIAHRNRLKRRITTAAAAGDGGVRSTYCDDVISHA